MSSKYHGLPDIDTAADIFETSDDPEPILRPKDNGINDDDLPIRPHSDLIDASGLPARRKAEKVFGRGPKRDPSKQFFRPRLPPLHSYGSDTSSDEEDVATRETPAARLRRLKAELEEVEAELKGSGGRVQAGHEGAEKEEAKDMGVDRPGKRKSVLPPRGPIDLVGELAGLRDRLDAVELAVDGGDVGRRDVAAGTNWKERLDRLSQPLPTDSESQSAAAIEPETGKQVGLSEIDKRLATLEDLIGPSDPALDSSSPLTTTLNKHDHLLTLLTQPRHLDAISRRVKLLLVDLDRAAAAARRQPAGSASHPIPGDKNVTISNADYQSLQALFALLPRLDPLLPIIPPLLARLRSLSGLHAAAGEVAEGLARLKEGERKSAEEVKELQSVVEGVQKGLDDAGRTISGNWESMEKRMKDLEERIKKLDT